MSDTSEDTLKGYIGASGLYMIGYKDTELKSAATSNSGSYVYAASIPETEAQPAAAEVRQAPAPVMEEAEPSAAAEEQGFPIAAAAGIAAAGAAGVYGLRRFLIALARRSEE